MAKRKKAIRNPYYRVTGVTYRNLESYNAHHTPINGPKVDIGKEAVELAKKLIKEGDIKKGQNFNILDLGAGKGVAIQELKEKLEGHGIKTRIIGVNLRPEKNEGNRAQSDVQALPFKDNSIHYVVSTHCTQYVPDKLRMFEEAHRVLHPKGIARIHFFSNEIHIENDIHFENGKPIINNKPDPIKEISETVKNAGGRIESIHEKEDVTGLEMKSLVINDKGSKKLKFNYHFAAIRPDEGATPFLAYCHSIYREKQEGKKAPPTLILDKNGQRMTRLQYDDNGVIKRYVIQPTAYTHFSPKIQALIAKHPEWEDKIIRGVRIKPLEDARLSEYIKERFSGLNKKTGKD